jgi:hypothetical protein
MARGELGIPDAVRMEHKKRWVMVELRIPGFTERQDNQVVGGLGHGVLGRYFKFLNEDIR